MKDEKVKETKAIEELEAYKTYQRGARKLFAVDRQVFTPLDVEGALPSSLAHRKMLAPQNVEGALPSPSIEQVQQLHKGKGKVLEEILDDEEEIIFI